MHSSVLCTKELLFEILQLSWKYSSSSCC